VRTISIFQGTSSLLIALNDRAIMTNQGIPIELQYERSAQKIWMGVGIADVFLNFSRLSNSARTIFGRNFSPIFRRKFPNRGMFDPSHSLAPDTD